MMICYRCLGWQFGPDDMLACPKCGEKMRPADEPPRKPLRTVYDFAMLVGVVVVLVRIVKAAWNW